MIYKLIRIREQLESLEPGRDETTTRALLLETIALCMANSKSYYIRLLLEQIIRLAIDQRD